MKLILLTFIVLFLATACSTTSQDTPTGNVPLDADTQIVHVGVSGASYTFDVESVEAGRPVKLIFDINQLQGCSRAVTVPAYKVQKLIAPGDNIVEFTPMASGPVLISCTMAMYTGELMVQ